MSGDNKQNKNDDPLTRFVNKVTKGTADGLPDGPEPFFWEFEYEEKFFELCNAIKISVPEQLYNFYKQEIASPEDVALLEVEEDKQSEARPGKKPIFYLTYGQAGESLSRFEQMKDRGPIAATLGLFEDPLAEAHDAVLHTYMPYDDEQMAPVDFKIDPKTEDKVHDELTAALYNPDRESLNATEGRETARALAWKVMACAIAARRAITGERGQER